MFAYLASPIDRAGESSFLADLRAVIQQKLADAGIGCYRPHLAYQANVSDRTQALWIDDINQHALWKADGVVAILPDACSTLGTIVEIQGALDLGKPVVLFTDIRSTVQVAAWVARGLVLVDLNDPKPLPTAEDLRTLLTVKPEAPLVDDSGLAPDLFVKYDRGATPLTRAHHTDAGLDLATLSPAQLHGDRKLIDTGVRVSIPDGWYGRITGRSSALARWNIQVHEGIIDAGYTGELKIGATYLGLGHVDIPAGTRLAQLILAPVWDGDVQIVDELPATLRGSNGWGSSGV